jgi:hypothetical protein
LETKTTTLEDAAEILGIPLASIEALVDRDKQEGRIFSTIIEGQREYNLQDLSNALQYYSDAAELERNQRIIFTRLSDARIKGVSRRFLIRGLGAAGAVGVAASGILAADYIEKVIAEAPETDIARGTFLSFFGNIDDQWSIDLGRIYTEKERRGFHRDHGAVRDAILDAQPTMATAESAITLNDSLVSNIKGDHIIIGGPLAARSTEIAWQYETVGRSRRRIEKPLIPLPYSFLLDYDHPLMKEPASVGWIAADGAFLRSEVRPLVDLHRRSFNSTPRASSTERVRDPDTGIEYSVPYYNDLVITVVPNFLASTFPGRGKLVNIQATNGIGIRAAELLLTHKGKSPLKAMMDAVSDASIFQSHFKVHNPERTSHGVHRFQDIEHIRSIALDSKDVPMENFLIVRELIRKELGTWI